jgi:hypothetical protein
MVKAHIYWQSLLAKLHHKMPAILALAVLATNKIASLLCCVNRDGQGKYSSDSGVSLLPTFSPLFL